MGNSCNAKQSGGAEREELSDDALAKRAGDAEEPVEPQEPPEPAEPRLTLAVVGARGIRNADWLPGTGKSDCYCVVTYQGRAILKTRTVNDSLQPVWDETVQVPDYADGEPLEFSLFDQDLGGLSDNLGRATLDSRLFAERGFHGEVKIQDAGKGGEQAHLKLKIKIAGRDYPPAPSAEVRLTIEKGSSQSYGLSLDPQDANALLIMSVDPGACEAHNKAARPEDQLRGTDFIVAVNGKTGSEPMLEEFRNQPRVELLVRRPTELSAIVDNGAKRPLGLGFPEKPRFSSLLITEVQDGPVRDWNEGKPESSRVRPGDRVVSVGGETGKAKELQAMIEKADRFQISLIRPGGEEP